MPQVHVSGPCLLFLGLGDVEKQETYTIHERPSGLPFNSAGEYGTGVRTVRVPGDAPVLLGTAKQGPRIIKRPSFRPLRTSADGDVPSDLMFTGEDALVLADVNWYDERVYRRCCARPFHAGTRGTLYTGSVGTLMSREQQTYKLYVAFPYSAKNAPGGALVAGGGVARDLGAAILGGVARAIGAALNQAFATMKNMPAGYRFLEAYLAGPDELDPLGSRAREVGLVFHAVRQRQKAGRADRLLYDHDLSELIGVKVT